MVSTFGVSVLWVIGLALGGGFESVWAPEVVAGDGFVPDDTFKSKSFFGGGLPSLCVSFVSSSLATTLWNPLLLGGVLVWSAI